MGRICGALAALMGKKVLILTEDGQVIIILTIEKYNKSDPVNIGVGFEISIKELVGLIVEISGFKGRIFCDKTKAGGQPRRMPKSLALPETVWINKSSTDQIVV